LFHILDCKKVRMGFAVVGFVFKRGWMRDSSTENKVFTAVTVKLDSNEVWGFDVI
jgi:hypothetical protein